MSESFATDASHSPVVCVLVADGDRAGHLTQVGRRGSHSGGNSAGQSQSAREHVDATFAADVAAELKRRWLSGGYARFDVVSAPDFRCGTGRRQTSSRDAEMRRMHDD